MDVVANSSYVARWGWIVDRSAMDPVLCGRVWWLVVEVIVWVPGKMLRKMTVVVVVVVGVVVGGRVGVVFVM